MDLKKFIVERFNDRPFVINNIVGIDSWKIKNSSIQKLNTWLKNTNLKFRMGQKSSDTAGVQWEGSCKFVYATLDHFLQWSAHQADKNNPMREFDSSTMWAYADYMYLKDLLEQSSNVDMKELLDWSDLGFSPDAGKDSAIWIGSEGAHTVCHQDTYGYNLVYQVSGEKRWTLFHPSEEDCLYPTRIPYEESSVFSKIDFLKINLNKFPKLKKSTPHVVTLKAGDMLFVPHKWWHFVENLQNSCSVNAWFPCEGDQSSHVTEAITRVLVGLCSGEQSSDLGGETFLNPTETMSSLQENLKYLEQAATLKRKSQNSVCLQDNASMLKKKGPACSCQLLGSVGGVANTRYVRGYCFPHFRKPLDPKAITTSATWVEEESCPSKRPKRSSDSSRDASSTDYNTKEMYKRLVECITSSKFVRLIAEELNMGDES